MVDITENDNFSVSDLSEDEQCVDMEDSVGQQADNLAERSFTADDLDVIEQIMLSKDDFLCRIVQKKKAEMEEQAAKLIEKEKQILDVNKRRQVKPPSKQQERGKQGS